MRASWAYCITREVSVNSRLRGQLTIQVNVAQDRLVSSTDHVQLRSGIQNTPGDANGASRNLPNEEGEEVVYGDFRSTVVAFSAPLSAYTANPERQ